MPYSPTTEELERQTVQYLKDTRRYSALKREGGLDVYVRVVVEATQWSAESQMMNGELESAAWFAAIREHILEREAD